MSIESVINDCLGKLSADDKARLEQFEKLSDPQTQAHHAFNVVGAAFYGRDGAYEAALKAIDEQFGADDAKIADKAKLRKVLMTYVKTFFDKSYSAISKVIEEQTVGMDDEKRFELYAHHFDRIAPTSLPGADRAIPLAELLEVLSRKKEMTALQLKEELDGLRFMHKLAAKSWLDGQLKAQYLSSPTLQLGGFAAYVIRQFEKAGYKFEDDAAKVRFMAMPVDELAAAYEKLKQPDPFAAYGLVRKERPKGQGQARVLPFKKAV